MSDTTIQGERVFNGPEKAAALLLMMGKPPASRLLKRLEQPDLRAVVRAAAGLGAVPATMLDRLVEEFAADFCAGVDLLGDAGQAKNMLSDALPPEQVAEFPRFCSRGGRGRRCLAGARAHVRKRDHRDC